MQRVEIGESRFGVTQVSKLQRTEIAWANNLLINGSLVSESFEFGNFFWTILI